jgi:glycosyltransferase involved in cell wall biosynthesis
MNPARPRTLYLCPELPGPAATGGMHAHAYLMRAFGRVLGDRMVVAAPARPDHGFRAPQAARVLAFEPDAAPGGPLGRLAAQARAPSLPDKVTMRASRRGRAAVHATLRAGEVDLVVIDHFDALALLDPRVAVDAGVPILYVAHNDEAALARDVATCLERAGLGRGARWRALAWRGEAWRTAWHETRLLRAATAVTCLSSRDRDALGARAPGVRTFAHLPIDADRWARPARVRPAGAAATLVFGANAAFAPNLEALRWLAVEFAPELARVAPHATVRVTGVGAGGVPAAWRAANVDYLGFLSADDYARTVDSADAFVCPVAHGSGVKMKVLEALGRGVPVLAADASWRGIDEAPDALRLPRDAREAAARAAAALADPSALQAATDALRGRVARTLAQRTPVAAIVEAALAGAPARRTRSDVAAGAVADARRSA